MQMRMNAEGREVVLWWKWRTVALTLEDREGYIQMGTQAMTKKIVAFIQWLSLNQTLSGNYWDSIGTFRLWQPSSSSKHGFYISFVLKHLMALWCETTITPTVLHSVGQSSDPWKALLFLGNSRRFYLWLVCDCVGIYMWVCVELCSKVNLLHFQLCHAIYALFFLTWNQFSVLYYFSSQSSTYEILCFKYLMY